VDGMPTGDEGSAMVGGGTTEPTAADVALGIGA
jgi:hypothetical protein